MQVSVERRAAGYRVHVFFSSRRRHTKWTCDWSSDVCSSDLPVRDPYPRRLRRAWLRGRVAQRRQNRDGKLPPSAGGVQRTRGGRDCETRSGRQERVRQTRDPLRGTAHVPRIVASVVLRYRRWKMNRVPHALHPNKQMGGIMIDRRTFMSLLATAAVAPRSSFAQGTAGKAALYSSVGPVLTHYEVDVEAAALTKRASVTLPANVQYAWPHASRKYIYVASSSSAPGTGPAGTDHHASAFRIDPVSGALAPHGKPIRLPTR